MTTTHPGFVALIVVSIVLAGASAAPTAAVSGENAITLDSDIPINSKSAIREYEQDGVVTRAVSAPQMSITISDDRSGVGVGLDTNPLEGSVRNDFVKITHKESMTRTVTIPISAAYWTPFPRDGLATLDENDDVETDLTPMTENGTEYTLLTITFHGQDSVIFPVPADAVAVYSYTERVENKTNRTFDVDLGLTGSAWEYIPPSVLGGNKTTDRTTVRIDENPETTMIQYNAGTSRDPLWLNVKEGKSGNNPVFLMKKRGVDGSVYVVSATNTPPRVRYTTDPSVGAKIGAKVRGARHIPSKILDAFNVDLSNILFLGGGRHGT